MKYEQFDKYDDDNVLEHIYENLIENPMTYEQISELRGVHRTTAIYYMKKLQRKHQNI
jgi:hypothetical protein